jgi:hypothetical protein
LLGLFGGAGVTLVWELILRPMRERRSIAEVLSAEVSLNMQMLSAAEVHASATKVPPDFEASTMVFDAVAARIGELPSQAVAEVIFLYRYFKQLNEMPKTYVSLIDELRALSGDSPHRQTVEAEIKACVSVFNGSVAEAINRCNITQPMLLKTAFPRWSPRRYGRPPSRMLDTDEMAARVRIAQAERAKVAEDVRLRDRKRIGQ